MCDEVAFLLYSLVKFFQPELVIQTGHLWGKSACVVLSAMSDGFLGERGGLETEYQNADVKFAAFVRGHAPPPARTLPRMISIDPEPMGVPQWRAGIEMLKKQFPDRFDFREMTSADFFATFREDTRGLRLMGIVDGDHSPAGCRFDLENFARLGAELIIVDDMNWLPELKPVARDFAGRAGYQFMNFDAYNGIALLIKPSQM